jgi:hypothetical protein
MGAAQNDALRDNRAFLARRRDVNDRQRDKLASVVGDGGEQRAFLPAKFGQPLKLNSRNARIKLPAPLSRHKP